jgi:hypothetical protein
MGTIVALAGHPAFMPKATAKEVRNLIG